MRIRDSSSWVLFLCLCINCIYAIWGFPVMTNDTECFLPAAVNWKLNGHLINTLYDAGIGHSDKFLFYPPGYPFIMSLFLLNTNITGIYFSTFFINSIFILSLFFYLKRIGNWSINFTLKDQLFRAILILIICSYAVPAYTRPEALVKALFSVLLLLTTWKNNFSFFIMGVVFVIIGITSPVAGIYLLPLSIIVFVGNQYFFKQILYAIAGVVLSGIIFMVIYPFSLMDLLNGVVEHAGRVVFNRTSIKSLNDIWHYHFIHPNNAFGLILAFFALLYFPFFIRETYSSSHKIILITSFTLLIFLVLYFSFKAIPMAYNLYVLTPFMIASLQKLYENLKNEYSKNIFILFSLMFTIGFFRNILITIPFLFEEKADITKTNIIIKKYTGNNIRNIAISNGLWPYFAQEDNIHVELFSSKHLGKYDMIFLQQYGSGTKAPIVLNGYNLVFQNFIDNPISFAGIKLASQPPFHQIAIYKKNEK